MDWEVDQLVLKLASIWDTSVTGKEFVCCIIALSVVIKNLAEISQILCPNFCKTKYNRLSTQKEKGRVQSSDSFYLFVCLFV